MKKVLMAFFFCLIFSVSVQAKTTLPTDKTTAENGYTLVGVEGSYVVEAQKALKRINEIRKEACQKGILDPRNKNKKLTASDYKPIKWSSELEYIARIRAAEASVYMDHQRPNGESWFDLLEPTGHQSWGEVLAWSWEPSMLDGIELWYSEKAAWEKQTGAVTGHYTQMIDPDNQYVGLGTFLNPNVDFFATTAGEFSSESNLNETVNTMTGDCIQTIEVDNRLLSNNLEVEQKSIKAGKQTKAFIRANGCKVLLLGNIKWTSSNEKVAKVDRNGKISAIDKGTANITVTSGSLSRKATIDVTTHNWDNGKVSKAATYKKTGTKTYTCKVCGAKKTETIKKLSLPKVGTVYKVAGNQYKITKAGSTVSLIKTSSTAKRITIPTTISVNGLTYKVTTIAAKAFNQNKKLQSVTVGANVRGISNNAFFKCPSLKTVNLKTVLLTSKTASKKAFKGANKKLVIKVPKKVKKSYQKIFKGIKVK